jgi:membrane protease YdiL (CAAX protease family)
MQRVRQTFMLLAGLFLLANGYALHASAEEPAATASPTPAPSPITDISYRPNYHLVGWLNTFLPGSGQALLGDPLLGAEQLTAEVGTFAWGYSISKRSPMTLDGVPEAVPDYNRVLSKEETNINGPLWADMLQEFGIKYHFVNTFDSYREAAKLSGVTQNIDQTSDKDLFLAPFDNDTLSSPWVYLPIASVALYTIIDYITTVNGTLNRQANLSPVSNALYGVNYLGVQSIGSGAPEEMFFRGFLQNEFQDAVPSPFFYIPAQTALFAFAHAPGNGRISAAVAGAYLGLLADHEHGQLSKGIAVHFWGVVMLGIETVLITNKAEHSIPPTAFQIQINY